MRFISTPEDGCGDTAGRTMLQCLTYMLKAKVVVEIGVQRGQTTLRLCEATKECGRVFGFDIWSRHGENNQFPQVGSKEEVEALLLSNGYTNFELTLVDSKHPEFPTLLATKCPVIDLAFIDGCHSYNGVLSDFRSVYPLLSERGIIAFHDTFTIDGSREFALELRTKFNDGTFDVWDFPFTTPKGGVTFLVKRFTHTTRAGISEMCGSPSTPEAIYTAELEYLAEQKARNDAH